MQFENQSALWEHFQLFNVSLSQFCVPAFRWLCVPPHSSRQPATRRPRRTTTIAGSHRKVWQCRSSICVIKYREAIIINNISTSCNGVNDSQKSGFMNRCTWLCFQLMCSSWRMLPSLLRLIASHHRSVEIFLVRLQHRFCTGSKCSLVGVSLSSLKYDHVSHEYGYH